MKRLIVLLLTLALLLCGCAEQAQPSEPTTEAPTTEATTEPATEPTTEPTEPAPVIRHPLTGEILEVPMTNRIFGVSIGNSWDSLPHYGVSKADILFESFVNGHTTRRYALYSDIASVEAIGGSRSMRMQFTDLSLGYDAIAVYAGGSETVIGDLNISGVCGIISQRWGETYHWREEGKLYEHALMVNGAGLVAYAENQGWYLTQSEDKDYGLRFTEEATPADGETAEIVSAHFVLGNTDKETLFTYDPEQGTYALSQYNVSCVDGYYGVPETFKNVFLLLCENQNTGVYHVVNTEGSGEGWFACGGRIIPILWHRADNYSPFTFTLTDGKALEQGVGTSYIGLAPLDSYITYCALDPEVEETQ